MECYCGHSESAHVMKIQVWGGAVFILDVPDDFYTQFPCLDCDCEDFFEEVPAGTPFSSDLRDEVANV